MDVQFPRDIQPVKKVANDTGKEDLTISPKSGGPRSKNLAGVIRTLRRKRTRFLFLSHVPSLLNDGGGRGTFSRKARSKKEASIAATLIDREKRAAYSHAV
jgi:hypothetical protein